MVREAELAGLDREESRDEAAGTAQGVCELGDGQRGKGGWDEDLVMVLLDMEIVVFGAGLFTAGGCYYWSCWAVVPCVFGLGMFLFTARQHLGVKF